MTNAFAVFLLFQCATTTKVCGICLNQLAAEAGDELIERAMAAPEIERARMRLANGLQQQQ
jgi:hypothetical protein